MGVISKRTLREFWLSSLQHEDSKAQLEAWHSETISAHWTSPLDIKEQFRSASILKNNRVVFNIAGNKYRLIVAIDYQQEACFIKFIGTHKQYDQINAETM
jgi:mRNA interferase HigB